jgi:hypothetical protein
MSHLHTSQLDSKDIIESTDAVPYIASNQPGQSVPRSKDEYELDGIRSGTHYPTDPTGEELLVEHGEDVDPGRVAPGAIPVRYKVLAFSMIIFFNTGSSFSESTLSPLKGIFRRELGVTSKPFILCNT